MNLARERDARDGRHCQIDDGQGRQDRNCSEYPLRQARSGATTKMVVYVRGGRDETDSPRR